MKSRKMFQSQELIPGKQEDEFSKPVESIMRCDDFKSNFARRLSNRYTSRSPVASTGTDSTLRLQPFQNGHANINENIPENSSTTPIDNDLKHNGGNIISPIQGQESPSGKPVYKSSLTSSVIRQTNMEVETLKWQLAQTEANRQMHIALLKQIVNFLNRVKEYIKYQSNEGSLPRSRSVVHVSKNVEYSLSPPKRMSTKKISKSISNVNGYKELWNQTRITVESAEREATQKISEEMSRLITLATTVLGTELPDLACSCHDTVQLNEKSGIENGISENVLVTESTNINTKESDKIPKIVVEPVGKNANNAEDLLNGHDDNEADTISLLLVHTEGSKGDLTNLQSDHVPVVEVINKATGSKATTDKRKATVAANFIENESGFSSMSSFQELGIPLINIAAPSPLKENGFSRDITDILGNTGKWKNNIDIGKKPMKVFWV